MTKVPFNQPGRIGREFAYLQDAMDRAHLSGDGYFTKRCTEMILAETGARGALLTHSCTAALEMAALLCDLQPSDEVIMPSFTFVSTANAVVLRGAVPVFVDVDPLTFNIDPERVAAAIGPKTKAIFAVHYAGFPAEMDALQEIADAHGLFLVEDAAQALGSYYKGRPCGSLCDLGAISFHETKNIISGEGGALTIIREEFLERAEIIREKGTNRSKFFRGEVDKYTWVDIGSSFLPSELVAAYLCAQLELRDKIRETRLAAFDRYMQAFQPLAERERVKLPFWRQHCSGNGHMFYLIMKDLDDRTSFIQHMRDHGVSTPFHYVPLHSSPAGERFGRVAGPMNETNAVSDHLVRLPMYFDLGSDIEIVIEKAMAFFD